MKAIGLKKEVFSVDEPSVCATVAYGFDKKVEARKVIAEYCGVDIGEVELRKVKVLKFKKTDGELYYFWGAVCDCCGQKNNGVTSFIWDN